MPNLLCPSMMCAEFGNLAREVHLLDEAKADFLHIDIMDGAFVPNFGMGLQDAKFIIDNAKTPVDIHLMIQNPGNYVKLFAEMGADIIYIHAEADVHAPRTLDKIVRCHASPGIAVNPGTAVSTIHPLLSLADYVLVMTVNPGFAGQSYLPFIDSKLDELIALKERYSYRVILDGACSVEKIRFWSSRGADGFILGTSVLFGKERPYRDIMRDMRKETEM